MLSQPQAKLEKTVLIYGERIRQARQIRGILRYRLAAQINIPTTQMRMYERIVRNRLEGHRHYNVVQRNPIPILLLQKIATATRFPFRFFELYSDPKDTLSPRFICSNPDDSCTCGASGRWMCDATFEREKPIFRDKYNRIIIDTETILETCDAPVCDKCALKDHKADKLYCQAHTDPRYRHKRIKLEESGLYQRCIDMRGRAHMIYNPHDQGVR